MDNLIQYPRFSVNPVEPTLPWLSEQVGNSLNMHLSSFQNSSYQPPLFADLIEDNPGYNLIPLEPVSHPDPQRLNESSLSDYPDIDLSSYDMEVDLSGFNMDVDSSGSVVGQDVDPALHIITDDFMMDFVKDMDVGSDLTEQEIGPEVLI